MEFRKVVEELGILTCKQVSFLKTLGRLSLNDPKARYTGSVHTTYLLMREN